MTGVVVAVTGSAGGLGRRVIDRLRELPGYEPHAIDDLAGDDLPEGTAVVVHLRAGDHDRLARRRSSAIDGTAELLGRLDAGQVHRLVLLSSAMVYGAWPNNPVPLTEDAPLRPDAGFVFARQLAAVEQLVDDWRRSGPCRQVAVLRPVPAMAADGTSGLVRALAAGIGQRAGEDDAPSQYLHLDDLADAVVLAVTSGLDGVYNVAPDGWIDAATVRSLAGSPPRLRLPSPFADALADLRWRFQRGPIPPGLRPYTRWPWLVANDRLRAEGWRPRVTNEQAYVEGTEARWFTMLTPKRKQELALGAMVLSLVVGVVASVVGVQAVRRRRRR
jgi:nucleoside-diphosphate-sugar epimerase